ncbi:hypothetical protein GGF31_001701 [Allomyces arbusculus]|nr:hypothetical protein GGF31_001701 [Allomyces arbusculus]
MSVFYVPLGDAFQQTWKVHELHDTLATPKDKKPFAGLKIPDWEDDGVLAKCIRRIKREASARLLFHDGIADLDVIQTKLRIPLDGASVADLQVLYTQWKTVSLHTHMQKSLRLAEPGEHMRNFLLMEKHMRVELDGAHADVALANPGRTQFAAIQSQRAVSLNCMFCACKMPENPLKDAPYRKDTLSSLTLYAALDVDMLEHACTHMRKCINTIKRDIKERVDDI